MSVLGRLIVAIDLAQRDERLIERQLDRMRDRVRAGVDVRGVPYRPYRRLPKDGRVMPLSRGGVKLIDRARIDVVNSLDGVDLSAKITGEAGRIVRYQNKMREFVGFSDDDRSKGRADFVDSLRKYMR